MALLSLAFAWMWVATGPAGATVDPGQGNAIAFTNRVDPRAGALSLGITFGIAIAGHTNTTAKAQSQAVDLGVAGTALGGQQCDGKPATLPESSQPQPLIVESGTPAAGKGSSQTDLGGSYNRFAHADATPFAESITTTAPLSLGGTIDVGGGSARSYSGIVNGQHARPEPASI